jgi:hypothetical protein
MQPCCLWWRSVAAPARALDRRLLCVVDYVWVQRVAAVGCVVTHKLRHMVYLGGRAFGLLDPWLSLSNCYFTTTLLGKVRG